MSTVWINGVLRDPGSASVGVEDRGFTLGDGLFETVRAYGGTAFRLRAHLERLADGARRIGVPLPDGLDAAVRETLAASGLRDAALRLTLSRGPGSGVAPPESARPTTVITARPYAAEPRWYADGIRAVVARGRLNEHAATAGLKQLGYLDAVLAVAEARKDGADDALLLDTAGHLAEGAASNVFLVSGGVLQTPPLTCGPLPGVTRAAVLEIAAELGIPADDQSPIPLDAIPSADEAFLTSSLREIVPLTSVDGQAIGGGWPGQLTMRLLARYREQVRQETRDLSL